MHTQSDIEIAIRTCLPLAFGKVDSAAYTDFKTRFDALVEYTTRLSEPILKNETVRYQSILLYWSLILMMLSFFQLGDIKIGEAIVKVDKYFFIIYSVFITTVAVVFLSRSYVDYQRTTLLREKNSNVIPELLEVIHIAFLRRRVQGHFWLEISNAINSAYKTYDDAIGAVTLDPKLSKFQPIELNSGLDFSQMKNVPALDDEIHIQRDNLAFFKTALTKDEAMFKRKIDHIIASQTDDEKSPDVTISNDRYEKVTSAFNQCLKHWVDAYQTLSVENFKAGLPITELKQSDLALAIIKRTARIRRIYTIIEIAAPVVFASASIVYVWRA